MILTIARLRLFLATFLVVTTYTMATPFHFNLTTVRGYFMQDEPGTDPDSFNYVFPPSFPRTIMRMYANNSRSNPTSG